MTASVRAAALAALVAPVLLAASPAAGNSRQAIRADLSSYEEVPTLSTPAVGDFRAKIAPDGTSIAYELSYAGLTGPVLQAHLHLGARATNGGIIIFLCSNLGNGPVGTPACPEAPATVTGTLVPEGVVGPAAQGIAAGEFDELIKAIRAGAVYANVHSQPFPSGEIRGQVKGARHRD